MIFECDGVADDVRGAGRARVEFKDTPREEPWGWWAAFNDPDGNHYGLSQPGSSVERASG